MSHFGGSLDSHEAVSSDPAVVLLGMRTRNIWLLKDRYSDARTAFAVRAGL